MLITLPALKSIGGVPIAFYAVVSVAVIGLYLSFLIPVFLRWRIGCLRARPHQHRAEHAGHHQGGDARSLG